MIGFIGLSHLGIVYSLATAGKGFDVLCFDPDLSLCGRLDKGQFPIAEPGLTELFQQNRARIQFTTDVAELTRCSLLFFSLDVPTDSSNRSDLQPLRELISRTRDHVAPGATSIILCQVPPGFTRSQVSDFAGLYYQVETLVFGQSIERAMHPERYIVGCEDPAMPLPEDYGKWLNAFGCPVLLMGYESAELTKIAINLFLVSSVTTTNTLAEICEQLGADWSEVAPALRLDRRIGPHAYLSPGLGLAGGNLERDLITLQELAAQHGAESGIVAAWQRNSVYRRDWVLRKLHTLVLSRRSDPLVAIWGLAYKPNTHSVKNSPALALLDALAPFKVTAYDPEVKVVPGSRPRLSLAESALGACRNADALIVMTSWAEFSKIEPEEIASVLVGKVVIDPFGTVSSDACVAAGLSHHRLGRVVETT